MAALLEAPRVRERDGHAATLAARTEQLPLLERRILFHPAKEPMVSSPPPGIEPLNRGFNQAAAAVSTDYTGVKRSWQDSNEDRPKQQQQRQALPEDLDWGRPLKIGAGLSNLGNTCFLNSVLQCLTYTPPLAQFFERGQHKASCRNVGFCAMCALENHVKNALRSWGKVISPSHLVKNLRSISRTFQPFRQEDAHEYLRYLMEALHKSSLSKASTSAPEHERSLLYKIFGGRLKSQVKCTSCLECSDTVDPFLDLSLDIMRVDTLAKALACFTANEVLDGQNKYQCLKCNKKVRALKRFTIETAPNVLTIQFKRFSASGLHGQKIDKKVHFERTLDIKPFMSNARDGAVYELYGVLVHSGWSTHSGHYYCFVRTSSDMWHVMDDTRVKQLSERSVLEQKAYILFYIRRPKARNSAPLQRPSASTASKSPAKVIPAASSPVGCPAQNAPGASTSAVSSPTPSLSTVLEESPEKTPATTVLPPKPIDVAQVLTAEQESTATETSVQILSPSEGNLIAPQLKAVLTEPANDRAPDASSSKATTQAAPPSIPQDSPLNEVATDVSVSNKEEAKSVCHSPENKNERIRNRDSSRKFDSGCLKLLKAMPKSRRFFLAKALDMDHVNVGPTFKRQKLNESGERTGLKRERKSASPEKQDSERPVAGDSVKATDTEKNAERSTDVPSKTSTVSRSELFGSEVARWDGIDGREVDNFLKAEHKVEAKRLDEWDEEYDRGKVKKVRKGAKGRRLTPCRDGGGSPRSSNPFQVLAEKQNK